jgi:hypothetical protein
MQDHRYVSVQEQFVETIRHRRRRLVLDREQINELAENINHDQYVTVPLVLFGSKLHVDQVGLPVLKGIVGFERFDHGLSGYCAPYTQQGDLVLYEMFNEAPAYA